MKTLKRLTRTVTASVNWVVSQIENHEGLVNGAISEVQEASVRAHTQLKKVTQDGVAMRAKLVELRDQLTQWEERARKVAQIDAPKALECMKRRKRIAQQIAELEVQEREHAQVEKQLANDLVLIQERLTKLRQQRNIMRTRQSRAEALKSLQSDEGMVFSEIDELFERWEHKITDYEDLSRTAVPTDELVEEFTNQEEREELTQELNALLAQR